MSIENYPPPNPQGGLHSLDDIERAVLVCNPTTTNAEAWRQYRDDFAANTRFKHPVVLETSENPEKTSDTIATNARPGDLLYVCGGDGTIFDTIQPLVLAGAADVALMTSPLGDARNTLKGLSPWQLDAQPSEAFLNGSLTTVYPIRTRVTGPENYTKSAMTISDVGGIATGAAVMDTPERRERKKKLGPKARLAYQGAVSLTVGIPKTRTLKLGPNTIGREHALALFAVTTHNVAKVARFDTQIDQHEFLFGVIEDKLPWHLFPAIKGLLSETLAVERFTDGDGIISFTIADHKKNRHAMIDMDGNAWALAPGSDVTYDQPGWGDVTHRPIYSVKANPFLRTPRAA